MVRRSEELRERYRRILAWSLVAAVAAHVAVFVLTPEFQAKPLVGSEAELDTAGPVDGANALVEALFRPPTVSGADGSTWTPPPDRVLPAEKAVRLEADCTDLMRGGGAPPEARIRLRVRASGRVAVLGLAGRSGDACADRVLKGVAADLRYHWLPNARFPAPVEVERPVTLVSVARWWGRGRGTRPCRRLCAERPHSPAQSVANEEGLVAPGQ